MGVVLCITGCLSGDHPRGVLYPDYATAGEIWRAIAGSWPPPPHVLEGLAVAPHSKWGDVSVDWTSGQTNHYVVRGDTGPYAVSYRGAPLVLDGGEAHVIRMTVDPSKPALLAMMVSAASVEVLDDANATDALDDAAARWRRYLVEQQRQLDAALDDADRGTPGRPLGPEQIAVVGGFAPRWVPNQRRFVIAYARSATRTSTQVVRTRNEAGCGKYRSTHPGFPAPRRVACPAVPEFSDVVQSRQYSADIALVVEYDAGGHLLRERHYAPQPRAQLRATPEKRL